MQTPTIDDVRAARARVHPFIRPTPFMRHPLLDAETGLTIHVKHENHNPTGAFKVRGGLNLVASLAPEERTGVVTASTGNHGQSIAFACQIERVPCTVTGFDPDTESLQRRSGAPGHRHLPYAVGDGQKHTLYVCSCPSNSSLYAPNPALLGRFQNRERPSKAGFGA